MKQLYEVDCFLEHVYDFDDEIKLSDIQTDFLNEEVLVPSHHFLVERDIVSGNIKSISTSGQDSCVNTIYNNVKLNNYKVI